MPHMELYFDLTHRDIKQSYPLHCFILLKLQLHLLDATGSKINANTVTSIPKLAETLFASSISDAWTVVTSAVVEKLTGTNKDADTTFISLILYPIT